MALIDSSLFTLLIASANVGARDITLIFLQAWAESESGIVSVTINWSRSEFDILLTASPERTGWTI